MHEFAASLECVIDLEQLCNWRWVLVVDEVVAGLDMPRRSGAAVQLATVLVMNALASALEGIVGVERLVNIPMGARHG